MAYRHASGLKKTALAKAALLSVCFAVAGTLSAAALDYNDVRNLVLNNVDENVIIGMAQQNASMTITPGQVTELRAIGASESLIATLLTVQQPTVTYVQPPAVTYVEPPVVVTTPTYVYPAPPVYYAPRRPTFGFSIGFGNGWGGRRHGYGGRRGWHRRW